MYYNKARSVVQFYPFATLGFDWSISGNEIYLVSPDGEKRWLVTTMKPQVSTTLDDLKLKLLAFQSTDKEARGLRDITNQVLNTTSIEEAKELVKIWALNVLEEGPLVRQNYNDIVEFILTDITEKFPDIVNDGKLNDIKKLLKQKV